jgi:hypothetical protein
MTNNDADPVIALDLSIPRSLTALKLLIRKAQWRLDPLREGLDVF